MPNYKILTEAERVFVGLKRSTGETLQAVCGDIVALLEPGVDGAHDAAVAAHVAAGELEPTAEAASTVPAPVVDEADADRVMVETAAVQSMIAAQTDAVSPPADEPTEQPA